MELFSRLHAEQDRDFTVYDLADVQSQATRCIAIGDAVLAVLETGGRVSFVLLAFHSSWESTTKMQLVFHGSGFAGPLRELRHTYWGEGGYLFYPPGGVIVAAFKALQEWFDLDI